MINNLLRSISNELLVEICYFVIAIWLSIMILWTLLKRNIKAKTYIKFKAKNRL